MILSDPDELMQLKTDLMMNGSNFSDFGVDKINWNTYQVDGLGIYNSVCGQLDQYILHWGIGLIIFYLIMSWFLWWFFNYGYKKLEYTPDNYVVKKMRLNFLDDDNRIYWYFFILDKIIKLFVGYTIVVIYLLYAR